jgi:hypothetical protein
MDPNQIEEVKKELLELIITHLKENKITAEDAKKLSQDFLDVLPIEDHKDLLVKLKSLGENYNEASEIYVQELSESEEQKRVAALNQMRNHIKQGDINKAIEFAKSYSN